MKQPETQFEEDVLRLVDQGMSQEQIIMRYQRQKKDVEALFATTRSLRAASASINAPREVLTAILAKLPVEQHHQKQRSLFAVLRTPFVAFATAGTLAVLLGLFVWSAAVMPQSNTTGRIAFRTLVKKATSVFLPNTNTDQTTHNVQNGTASAPTGNTTLANTASPILPVEMASLDAFANDFSKQFSAMNAANDTTTASANDAALQPLDTAFTDIGQS